MIDYQRLKRRVELALAAPGTGASARHKLERELVSDLWREVCRLRQQRPLLGSSSHELEREHKREHT